MIQNNVNLLNFNTFGMGVQAKLYSQFDSVDYLKSLLEDHPNEEILILGGGSNIPQKSCRGRGCSDVARGLRVEELVA